MWWDVCAARVDARQKALGLLLFLGLMIPSAGTSVAQDTPDARREALAPDFALRSLEGQNLRLSEFRGEVVMVNFWASWCGACRQAMPALNDLDEKYRRAGLVLLSINIDDEDHSAVHMAQGLKIRFPVLRDDQKLISRMYKADKMPLTVLVGRDGAIRYSHVGYNLGDERKYLAELRTLLNE
jgi:thiol-disulfide isomerase/thioredoxin